jgi:peptidoglycan/LPS O-acetylase OafA/YrhL
MSDSGHKNNFDFMRLVAAATVLVSHQFVLSGLEEPKPLPDITWGEISVMVFFVISGFLVTHSWLLDPSFPRFIGRRLLRLIPALAVATLLSAFVLGPLVSTLSLEDYFSSGQTWRYLNVIRLAIVYELPGVFIDNPYPRIVNGSIWTLPLEGRWYLVVAFLGLAGGLRYRLPLLIAWIAGSVLFGNAISTDGKNHPDIFWMYGLFFTAGMYFAVADRQGKIPGPFTFALLCVAATLAFLLGNWFAALAFLLPPLVLWFGQKSFPIIREAGHWGDLSYGVYVFAFPVQQTVIHLAGRASPFAILLSWSLGATFLLALGSWHWVESPTLAQKKRFKGNKA